MSEKNGRKTHIEMKFFLLFVATLIGFGIHANAQDASGQCKLPGTHDYAKVDFYKGASGSSGNFVIGNSSSQIITEIKVKITASIKVTPDTEERVQGLPGDPVRYKTIPGRWETKVLYNNTLYRIGANQTPSYSVAMPKYYDIKDMRVSVSNLICKPINN